MSDTSASFQKLKVVFKLLNFFQASQCYFLHKEAEDDLHHLLVDDVCSGRISFLRPAESAKSLKGMRRHIHQLLTEPSLQKIRQSDGLKETVSLFAHPESAKKVLLLLRGLLLNRVLLLCLKKRWNVQYGLHPSRDPVAVPYHSRGTSAFMISKPIHCLFLPLFRQITGLGKIEAVS